MSNETLMTIAVIVGLTILGLVMALVMYIDELKDQRRVTEFYRDRLRYRTNEVLELQSKLRMTNDLDGVVTSIDAEELERIMRGHTPNDRIKRDALLDLRELAQDETNTGKVLAFYRD